MPTVNWTGNSGNAYNFELYSKGQEFKPLAAVYILCTLEAGGNSFHPLYIGETQSLYDRLNAGAMNHDGFKRASRLGFTHICVLQCPNSITRLATETDLRHSLNPVCNAQSNPVRG